MNNLSQYILEKLVINKDSKVIDPKKIIYSILDYLKNLKKTKIDDQYYDIIDNWVKDNKIEDIDIYYFNNDSSKDIISKLLNGINYNSVNKSQYFTVISNHDYHLQTYGCSLEDARNMLPYKFVIQTSKDLFIFSTHNGDTKEKPEINLLFIKK